MYQFHHIGIPTEEIREGERYSPTFKMYTSDAKSSQFRVQYHRFDEDSPLHPMLKTQPHVALKVPNLEQALEGKNVLLEPYEPIKGFRVAVIEEGGAVFEFVETDLSDEEIWAAKSPILYPEDVSK